MAEVSPYGVRRWSWIVGGVCTLLIGVQFIRPELPNSPATDQLKAPFEVKHILRNSCYDCHSNQTKLPWFDEVAPAYWLVTHDVKEGRKHLNFSEISRLPASQQKAVLVEAVNEIQLNAMPLPAYRLVHPGSVITPEELAVLRRYVKPAKLNRVSVATNTYRHSISTNRERVGR